ncbi:hypothetical protein K523DRAFT_357552 [Schizophyllum commune Tattone D]|nr:hypothetical protein K523DRAFT_357552 [Schizophyllum commune Tattone D]
MSSSMGPTSMPIARSAPMSMGSLLHPPEAPAQPQYAPYTSAHPYVGYSHNQYAYHPYQTYGAMQSPASAPSQVPSASEYEYSEAISYDAPRRRAPSMMNNAPHQYRRQQGDYAPAPPAHYAQESAPSYSDGGYYGGHAAAVDRYPHQTHPHSTSYSAQASSSSHSDPYAPSPPQQPSNLPPLYRRQVDYRRQEDYHPQADLQQYPDEYNMPHDESSISLVEYQPAERMSVRLAARRTTPPEQSTSSAPNSSSGRQKRPAPPTEEEEDQAPAKKKRKPSKPTISGASRRGFTAQKRMESAANANLNARLAGLAAERVVVERSSDLGVNRQELKVELQVKRCMTGSAAGEVPKCVACTRRWAGDTCRFQGIRYFGKDKEGKIITVAFKGLPDPAKLNYPDKWNVKPTLEGLKTMKLAVAKALLPILHDEQAHFESPIIVKRKRECDVRVTCDHCNTSIFSAGWMCRNCGREACPACYEIIKQLTQPIKELPADQQRAVTQKRNQFHHNLPFFLNCSKRGEHQAMHFSPVTRFQQEELAGAIREMEAMVRESEAAGRANRTLAFAGADRSRTAEGTLPVTASALSEVPCAAPAGAEALPAREGEAETYNTPSYTIRRMAYENVTEDVMRAYLARGEPLIVTGLDRRMQISWTPEYFIEHYGDRSCLITNCVNESNKQITVKEFFETFGKYEERDQMVWKLKDWPPMADFKTSFPELYKDFMDAVPVPSYIRRDGVMNISSHFPTNTIAPDLGPKMYNAQASSTREGSKGSTRLHMDMADALNIMTYAAPTADENIPAGAAWDIFRPEDSATIRDFMRRALHRTNTDPIHSQHYYLDDKLRHELFAATGVRAFHFQQRPGEAVVIPAGCAHQVSNLSDCIKVAVDFVSPENVERCERLTEEFRQENHVAEKRWKEDVLQLKTMMWYAWVNCCKQENKLKKA